MAVGDVDVVTADDRLLRHSKVTTERDYPGEDVVMPSFIVKAEPDTDLYVYWSTIVEAPTFVGTRAELTDHLLRHDHTGPTTLDAVAERFARADARGSSGIPPFDYGTW